MRIEKDSLQFYHSKQSFHQRHKSLPTCARKTQNKFRSIHGKKGLEFYGQTKQTRLSAVLLELCSAYIFPLVLNVPRIFTSAHRIRPASGYVSYSNFLGDLKVSVVLHTIPDKYHRLAWIFHTWISGQESWDGLCYQLYELDNTLQRAKTQYSGWMRY